jgi:hypothetical protein
VYSLAGLYLNGAAGAPKNIVLAAYLYSLSASQGNVRAIATLSHALLDSESWLGVHFREQERAKWKNVSIPAATAAATTAGSSKAGSVFFGQSSDSSAETTENDVLLGSGDVNGDDNTGSGDEKEEEEDELTRWGYNSTQGITIIIASTGLVVKLPDPLRPDCNAALPLIKHLSEYSYRTNDLMKEALELYLDGDRWGALDLYEEAADLGVHSAQENAAFLYGIIAEEECTYQEEAATSQSVFGGLWLNIKESSKSIPFISTLFDFKKSLAASGTTDATIDPDELASSLSYRGYSAIVHSKHCQAYFRDMATRRWIQVANGGDVDAIREVAQMYQGVGGGRHGRRDSTSAGHLTPNVTKAALLYGYAAANFGDISSVMALAWMVQRGSADGEYHCEDSCVRSYHYLDVCVLPSIACPIWSGAWYEGLRIIYMLISTNFHYSVPLVS